MGHVMNLLVDMVREAGGEPAVQRTFSAAGMEPVDYHFERIYPEAEFTALLGGALDTLGASPEQGELAFAEYFMRVSPVHFPAVFKLSGDARTLLERVPHLHRSMPSAAQAGAFREKLRVAERGPDWLLLHYRSPHRLCTFLQRAVELLLQHYGERGEIRELECARRGAPACLVHVRFLGCTPAPSVTVP